MNYFRRPKIANKALVRSSQATIRGNVRRHDADGLVSSPYFPNTSVGQNLVVVSQTGTVDYSLTSTKLSDIIVGLNSSGRLPNIAAEAFDWDGCLGLRSTVTNSTSYIEVVEGTAAAGLGFDLGTQKFVSRGGDILSSGEGRIGAAFGSALANPGENLTTTAINRGIGRLAANSDVLWADVNRDGVVVKKIASISVASSTSASPLANISISSVVGPTQKVYTGGQIAISPAKVLNVGASVSELARFYFLVDAETGTLAPSSITDVTSSAGGATILGSEQQVLGSTAITAIPNGSTIQVDSVNFTSLNVLPGDYVRIAGATNNTPWSNNGYKWAVESVTDSTHISVRPLSASEQVRCGETIAANSQPILELNSDGSGFGNITITRGPWATNAYLAVSPEIPKGASYELWAAVPANLHDVGTHELGAASQIAASSDIYPAHPSRSILQDYIVVAPTITGISLSDVVISEFYVRSRGKLVRVPSCALTRNSASAEYVYWDTNTCQLAISSSIQSSLGTSHLYVARLTANSTSYELPSRVLNKTECVLTVGVGQQFATLKAAVDYARVVTTTNAYQILLCDTTALVDSVIPLNFPVHIRGLTDVTLYGDGGSVFPFTSLQYDAGVVLENISISNTGIQAFRTAYPYVTFKNVRRLLGNLSGSIGQTVWLYANKTTEWTSVVNVSGDSTLVGVNIPAISTAVEAAKTILQGEFTNADGHNLTTLRGEFAEADSAVKTEIKSLVIPWTTPTLYQNIGCDPWVTIPHIPFQYCKDSFGFVHFRGMLQVPVAGLINASSFHIMELSASIRPASYICSFIGSLGDNNSTLATQMLRFTANNAGTVGWLTVYGATSTQLASSHLIYGLDGVSYYAG